MPFLLTNRHKKGHQVFQTLVKAIDIGNREWDYTYSEMPLYTKVHFLNVIDGGEDPGNTCTTVTTLTSVNGPGVGYTTINYATKSLVYTDTTNQGPISYQYSVAQDRLYAASLSKSLGQQSAPMQTTSYTFVVNNDGGNYHQFFTGSSVVNDGRLETETTFTEADLAMNFFSDPGNFVAASPEQTPEVVGQVSQIQVLDAKSGTVFQTVTQKWNTNQQLTDSLTQKSATNFTHTVIGYDTWGNVTSTIAASQVGTRKSHLEVYSTYYNTGTQNLALRSGMSLTEPALQYNQHNLLAVKETDVYAQGPNSSNESLTTEYQYATYNTLGQPVSTSLKDSSGSWKTTIYDYDPSTGQVADTTAANGQVTSFSYDYTSTPGLSIVTSTSKAVGLSPTTSADLVTVNALNTIDGTNAWTRNPGNYYVYRMFDVLGRPIQVSEPWQAAGAYTPNSSANPVTTIQYDDGQDGSLSATVTNPIHLVTKYTFDNSGRVIEVDKTSAVVSSLGLNVSSETISEMVDYDGYNEVIAVHGPVSTNEMDSTRTSASLTTNFTYDSLGRELSRQLLGAKPALTTYDDTSNTVTFQDEVGDQTFTILDWAGKTISKSVLVSGQPQTVSQYYDGQGRLIDQVDPIGNVSAFTYNALGQESSVVAPSRTVWEWQNGTLTSESVAPEIDKTYDDGGFLSTLKQRGDNGQSQETDYTYNGIGKLLTTSAQVTVGTTVQTLTTDNSYSPNGDLLSQATYYAGSVGTTKSWTYDAHGRVLTATVPNDSTGSSRPTATTRFEYDFSGNRKSVTDPRAGFYPGNFTLVLNYDGFGRLIEADLPTLAVTTSPKVVFRYDGNGNLVERQETDGEISKYHYTSRNLNDSKIVTDGTTAYTSYSGYNDAGELTSTTSPSGRVDKMTYDEAGRLLSQGNDVSGYTRFAYYPTGLKKSVTDGRGNSTSFQYNPEGKVTSETLADNSVVSSQYDRWNRLTQSQDGERNQRWVVYDEIGRIIQTTNPAGGRPISRTTRLVTHRRNPTHGEPRSPEPLVPMAVY